MESIPVDPFSETPQSERREKEPPDGRIDVGDVKALSHREPIPFWPACVHDRNPFFLFASLFILAGCFLVTHATHSREATDASALLLVVALLHLFVVVSIGLAVWHARHDLLRDAGILLAVPILLIGDAGFVQTELVVQYPEIGWPVMWGSLLLTLGEVWAIGRLFGIRWSVATWIALAGSLVMTLGVIGVAAGIVDEAELGPVLPFVAVWITALLLVVGDLAPKPRIRFDETSTCGVSRSFAKRLARFLPTTILVLMLIHTLAIFVVFDFVISTQHAVPIALAGVALGAIKRDVLHRGRWVWSLSAAAILLSLPVVLFGNAPRGDTGLATEWLGASWTPLRGALLVLGMLYVWMVVCGREFASASCGAVVAFGAAGLGAEVQTMIDRLERVVPTSQFGWGLLAIFSAFGCLALGTFFAWRQVRQDSVEPSEMAAME